MAGLIPAEMADILATPSPDAAMTRKHTKRITGARGLTADDYRGMLHEDKRKEGKFRATKNKENGGKREKREKKKEEIARRKEKKVGKGKGKLQQRLVRRSLILHTSSDSDSDSGVVTAPR